MKDDVSFIKGILESRMELTKLIIITILITFSINIISTICTNLKVVDPIWFLISAIIILLISVIYLFLKIIKREHHQEYNGFFEYDLISKKIIPVERYNLGTKIAEYFAYLFSENAALKAKWQEESPPGRNPPKEEGQKFGPIANGLINEALEYYILSRLSSHLSTYFNNDLLEKENIKTYKREDVPDIFFQNRFLQLFSTPREERIAFIKPDSKKRVEIIKVEDDGSRETIMAFQDCHEGTAFYELFDLTLPKGSKVNRPTTNEIKIDTDKITILIKYGFNGFCEVLPSGFEQVYLGIRNGFVGENYLHEGDAFKININININMKLKAFLSRSGWEYYNWIDSFLSELEEEASTKSFLKKIGWETIVTYIICDINRSVKSKTKKPSNTLQKTLTNTNSHNVVNPENNQNLQDSAYV